MPGSRKKAIARAIGQGILVLPLLGLAGAAQAQTPAPTSAPPPAGAPPSGANGNPAPAQDPNAATAPASSGSPQAPAAPTGATQALAATATGGSGGVTSATWSSGAPAPSRPSKPPARRTKATAHATISGPVATLPGFEMLADGASHLFVQLSQSVEVQETRTGNRVTYLLKGARVLHHNNENSLVTTFFNTPVERARLLPAKGGLDFVIDLRASVTPTWKISPAKDNSAIFEVVLPKGDYLKGAAQPSDDSEMAGQGSPNAAPSPPPAAATTPMGGRRHRRLGGGGAGAGGGGGAGGSTGGSGLPAQ